MAVFSVQHHLNNRFAVTLHDAARLCGLPAPFGWKDSTGKSLLHHAIECSQDSAIIAMLQAHPPLGLMQYDTEYPIVSAVKNRLLPLNAVYEMLEVISHTREMFTAILYALRGSDVDAERRLLIQLFVPVLGSKRCLHVHICGDGFAGKTTLKEAMKKQKEAAEVPFIPLEHRTIGMTTDIVEMEEGRQLILHDYGGQEDFHFNHSRFLATPGSTYIIVVSLWDPFSVRRIELAEIEERFRYWLKFVWSLAFSGANSLVITVLTVVNVFKDDPRVGEVLARLTSIVAEWKLDDTRVMECIDVGAICINKVDEVKNRVMARLLPLVDNSYAVESTAFWSCVQEDKPSWKVLCPFNDFESIVTRCVRVFTTKQRFVGEVSAVFVDALVRGTLRKLLLLGEITLVEDASKTSESSWVVTNVDWLASDLLGRLATGLKSLDSTAASVPAQAVIDLFTPYVKDNAASPHILLLLEALSFCIKDGFDIWIPALVVNDDASALVQPLVRLSPTTIAEQKVWRCLTRRFQLENPHVQFFPPGYFCKLYVDMARALGITQKHLQLRVGSLEASCHEGRTQLILQRSGEAFDITVTSVRTCCRDSSSSQAWTTFNDVRRLILGSDNCATSWTERVPLIEVFTLPLINGGVSDSQFTEDEMYARVRSDDTGYLGWIYGISADGTANEGLSKSSLIESQLKKAKVREMEAALRKLSPAFLVWRVNFIGSLDSIVAWLCINLRSSIECVILQNARDIPRCEKAKAHTNELCMAFKTSLENGRLTDGANICLKELRNEMNSLLAASAKSLVDDHLTQADAWKRTNEKLHETILVAKQIEDLTWITDVSAAELLFLAEDVRKRVMTVYADLKGIVVRAEELIIAIRTMHSEMARNSDVILNIIHGIDAFSPLFRRSRRVINLICPVSGVYYTLSHSHQIEILATRFSHVLQRIALLWKGIEPVSLYVHDLIPSLWRERGQIIQEFDLSPGAMRDVSVDEIVKAYAAIERYLIEVAGGRAAYEEGLTSLGLIKVTETETGRSVYVHKSVAPPEGSHVKLHWLSPASKSLLTIEAVPVLTPVVAPPQQHTHTTINVGNTTVTGNDNNVGETGYKDMRTLLVAIVVLISAVLISSWYVANCE